MDLCECSSACALCYDTVQRRAMVLVRCNVVGMVGGVGDRGHGNWGRETRTQGDRPRGCRREPIEPGEVR